MDQQNEENEGHENEGHENEGDENEGDEDGEGEDGGDEAPDGSTPAAEKEIKLSFFERYLSVWVFLCIFVGIIIGRVLPEWVEWIDKELAIFIRGVPVVSIPIAICLFAMMFPIMLKIRFSAVLKAFLNIRPLLLTLFINWVIHPFLMLGIATFFLGFVFRPTIGDDSCDALSLPPGYSPLNIEDIGKESGFARIGCWNVGAAEGSICKYEDVYFNASQLEEGQLSDCLEGTDEWKGVQTLPLWRSYLAGCILLGIAPCTAMVLVWGALARGNQAHTLLMVAVNTLLMLPLYGLFD